MNLAQLRHERDKLADKAQAINAKYAAGARMPADEAQQLDGIIAQIERIDGQIDAITTGNQNAGLERDPDWSDSQGGAIHALRTPAEIRGHYSRSAQASQGSRVRLDDFVRGVAGMKCSPEVQASLSVGTDSSGGFAVPSVVMPGILEALVPASALLSAGAGIIPLTEGAKKYTTAAVDNIPTAHWRLENGDIQESEPTFRAVEAAPKSLAFYFKISRELLADAGNIVSALTHAIAQAFAVELDRAGLRGSGVNPEPKGLANMEGVHIIASGANGSAMAGYGKFFEAAQQILQANAPMPTAAIMSPRSLIKLGGLQDTTGQPLRRPDMLQTIQHISTPAMPDDLTTGTSNDTSEIYLGDFTKFYFMMRESMSIQVAKEVFALKGQVGFICHVRADVMTPYPQQFAIVRGVRP